MEFSTNTVDPQGDLWADPEFVDEYLDAVVADYEARASWDSEIDAAPAPAVFDEFADVENVVRRARASNADQDRLFARVLRRAEADPEPWIGPDPTSDPEWEDPRGRSVASVRLQRRLFAVRAAAADLAVRLRLSEHQVRTRAHRADVLEARCPLLWHAQLAGEVSEHNAATAAALADTLPADDPDAWAAFDRGILDAAQRLAPGRFRTRARAVRERVHAEPLQERHRRAAADRYVSVEPGLDGMAMIEVLAPAVSVSAIDARLDAHARHLIGVDGETRTFAQLRTDALIDLLTSLPDGTAAVTATIAVTVPALSLLDRPEGGDQPATLDGYGPIDLDTARRLAGEATSWVRILTDPVEGTIRDIDRRSRRVPADLRRWVQTRYPTCVFPGCLRPARECDLDHLTDWQYGGVTSDINLAPECKRHHPIKHETLWRVRREPDSGTIVWTSPTGYETASDPPPF